MDDYLNDFIRESEENITELNNSLLELEDNPDDEAAMDSIFRTAHTLKGNSGAMGFTRVSDLAHAIEDLLDEIRQNRIDVTAEIMDLVFEGVDEIKRLFDEIAADGEASSDPGATIDRIRSVIDDSADDASTSSDSTESDHHTSPPFDAIDSSALVGVEEVFHAHVRVGETDMKGVDGMFVLNAVMDAVDVLGSEPDVAAIQDGQYDVGFHVFVTCIENTAELQAVLDGIGKVEAATVTDVTDTLLEESDERDDATAEPTTTQSAVEETDDGGDTNDGDTAGSVRGTTDADNGSDATDSNDEADSQSEKEIEEIKSIRVDVEQLDDLHGLVEQLVTSRIKLRRSIEQGERKNAEDNLDELDKITSSLQDTTMDMRLVPMKKVVSKFPRLVRDLSRSQEKEISFEMDGEDIELDRTILNEISDPLMHLIRNAIDHGIEPPAEREQKGKDRTGNVQLTAKRERDRVTITIEDDGRGLDVASIRTKAVEKGIMTREEVDELEQSEVYELIFHAGFSTSEEVTDVSGRGVGMDVVNNTIKRLDGSISVDSEPNAGTTIRLSLPVTVAIVKVLFVESGDEEYGVPIKNVDEIARLDGLKTVEGEEVITHDDVVYPIIRLGDALNVPGATKNGDGMLVRIKESERQVAIHCDAVSRQEEVVVKPFEGILSGIPGLSGAAVLGEGDVVTILDVETL